MLQTFRKSEITCSHVAYHGNQNFEYVSWQELTHTHMKI